MAARCCNGQLWRGHRSRRFRPCLVRMAVGARALGFYPDGFCLHGRDFDVVSNRGKESAENLKLK
jgi:hypothetical protein